MPPCKTSVAAGMPAPLAEYVEPDAHGYPIFSYPAQVGRLLGELSHINRMMASAMSLRGQDRENALKHLAEEISNSLKNHDTIQSQWNEVLKTRIAARVAAGG
jgi:hypothetical protein